MNCWVVLFIFILQKSDKEYNSKNEFNLTAFVNSSSNVKRFFWVVRVLVFTKSFLTLNVFFIEKINRHDFVFDNCFKQQISWFSKSISFIFQFVIPRRTLSRAYAKVWNEWEFLFRMNQKTIFHKKRRSLIYA